MPQGSALNRDLIRELSKPEKKKFLGLNIIVGPGEHQELERCLQSCQGPLFDEVVVTVTSEDEKVKAVAERYADKVPYFKWIQDFSAARNYSFSQNTSEYIFWLDADDVIKPDEYQKLLAFKPEIYKYEIVVLDYVYTHDDKDQPVLILPRERIVKNCDHIKWHDPIHEYLNMSVPPQKIKRTHFRIDHYRVKSFDPNRNLSLLKKEYDKGNCSTRIQFYYGKELSDAGRWEEAIPVLEDYVNKGKGYRDNQTVACIRLSKHYYENGRLSDAKNMALKGIRFNSIYAENYVTVGTIYQKEGDTETAEKYYKEAMTKKLEGGMSQIVDFYGFIPAVKLTVMYMSQKRYEEALKYCEMSLKYKPHYSQMSESKRFIIKELEKLNKETVLDDESAQKILAFIEELGYTAGISKNRYDGAVVDIKKKVSLDVVWLMPEVSMHNAATRIRRLNVHNKLKEMGIKSRVIADYRQNHKYEVRNMLGEANVVVFTQFGEYDLELMKHLKSSGIKVIRDICEAVYGYPYEAECFDEADAISVCSTKLEELTKDQGHYKTYVIKDPIEPVEPENPVLYEDRCERPKAVFMGHGGNSFLVSDVLKPVIEKAGYDLVLITEWDDADVKWDINTWPDEMSKCDVALCPQRVDIQPAKSNVKVTTAMALGLPVIGSPLPSYLEIIEHGKNGYICSSNDEWYEALVALKDPVKRKEIGEAGKASVKSYTVASIARNWKKFFEDLVTDSIEFEEPEKPADQIKPMSQVDIIIPNYNNVEYLKLCVSSILLNTINPFHIIVSDSGSDQETWDYLQTLKGITVLGEKGVRKTFSEACNAGIEASYSKYFVVLNSDTLVSKGWLKNLVDKMDTKDRLASCGVLSNCDRGWLHDNPHDPSRPKYNMKLEKAGIELVPGMKLETIKPHIEELYEFMKKSNEEHKGIFVDQQWVAAYATIFARSAINETGSFDPLFKNGCEDLDLCKRLSSFGYNCGQAIDSFVYHFGGISRGAYQIEDRDKYDKEDVENHDKYKKKWARQKIAIWTGPAWEPWDKKKVDAGMAGSETWASYLAEAFALKGYDVWVYNDFPMKGKEDYEQIRPIPDIHDQELIKNTGIVTYRDHTHMLEDLKYEVIDYFISSRSTEPLKQSLRSVRHYVMIHDIWLNGDPNYDLVSWKVSKYAYLSDWHKQFLMQHHKMPENKMFLTANGVVQSWYDSVDESKKKNQMVYSSSPDRGLYQLLQMLPDIRKEVPDFKLIVCYGFYNWESSAKGRNDTASLELIEKIKGLLEQPGVDYRGRVDKKTLSELQKVSNVWLYPTWFAETFCIGAVENGLSRNALLSTDLAGLKTTVNDSGILLPPNDLTRDSDYPKAYKERFVKNSVRLLTDSAYRKMWADKAYKKMLAYTWDKIADGWIREFRSE